MSKLSFVPRRRTIIALVAVGLVARLVGVLFNGMHDVDQIILIWGMAVRQEGLGPAFAGVYGVLSYALFGAAADGVTLVPRFWWAPYKLLEIGSEAGILACLWYLPPPGRRFWALPFFWLNPWFVLHGAWQGFWDGPYTLFGLLALVVLRTVRGDLAAWGLAGATLMLAALFKPQGLAYFVLPMGVYVLCMARAQRSLVALVAYSLGVVSVLVAGSLALGVTGGDSLAQISSFASAAATMPGLCNNCIGIWRPISGLLQAWLGQEGPAYSLVLPSVLESRLNLIGLALGYGTVVLAAVSLAWRSSLALRPADRLAAGVLMTIAALAVPQLATHAHSNHTYAGVVLLIPLVLTNRVIGIAWSLMAGILFYSHLAAYQLGQAFVLAPDVSVDATAPVWVRNLRAVQDASARDALLMLQGAVNAFVLRWLPVDPLVPLLSVVMFGAVVCVLWQLVASRLMWRIPADVEYLPPRPAWAVKPEV